MKSNLLLVIASVILILGCEQKSDEKFKKPNILFAIADDASWKHFGRYGCNWIKTPAFDRVAASGILFKNAYTPNAKCAPSRSCILTGRNSWQLEEAANHSPYFPEKFKTYPEVLNENGYWVGFTGKGWAPGNPGKKNGKIRELTGQEFNNYITQPPTNGISNKDYALNFEAFLEERPNGKPFCFWYGGHEPHRRYEYGTGISQGQKKTEEIDEVPDFWPDVDTVRTDMLDYAFEIEYFDSHLKKMLNKLEEIDELDNTIVIVTADNGMPFPRIKGQVYEYSNHLPLAIMWPNGIKNPGRIVEDMVNFIDFAPTYLELAKLAPAETGMQAMTGKSLTDIFYSGKSGKVIPERDFVLVGKERHDVGRPDDTGYPVRGIIKNGFLYLRNFENNRWPGGNPETGYLNCDGSPTKTYILNTRREKGIIEYWQLNFGMRPAEELYNIKDDPFCMTNLIDNKDYAAIKSGLETEMTQKLKDQNDPRISRDGSIFDNYMYSGAVRNFYNRYTNGEKIEANWVNKTDFEKDLSFVK